MGVAVLTLEEAEAAHEEWSANCGPCALAACLGLSLAEVRPHMGDFEKKGYTNPTLMLSTLKSLGVTWKRLESTMPSPGLCRVQWEGPWTAPGVPIRARYRHSHWIATRLSASAAGTNHRDPMLFDVFDVNALCVGGWLCFREWSSQLVPWLLKECHPKANGAWHFTHRLEVLPSAGCAV